MLIMKELFNKQVRIKHSNKCFECGIVHGVRAVKSAGGTYRPVDDFELNHEVKINSRIVKIWLKVLPLNYSNSEMILSNYAPFCPAHAQQHMKEQITKIRASDERKSKGLGVCQVVEVKNWFHNSYGFRPSTKDVVFLYQYFEKLIVSSTEL